MTDNKRWIEELNASIIDDNDKILFRESTNCFLAKNFRAAYIMSWIGITESLKRKIQLFSNLGDSRATESYTLIEKFEEENKSTDRLIFEESKKCGIIDNADLSTIKYLWEQRCLFAHPYNKQPEEDEVKHIIGQSIKLVLGKELFYNKGFLSELAENIANKPFFLPTELERVREFAKRTISRTPEDLHPFLFKTLLFKVGEFAFKQEKFSELKKLRYYLIELFINTPLSLDNPNWSLENKVTKFPYECFIGFVHIESWFKIPIRIKEMLISYLINETDENKLLNLKSITVDLIIKNELEEELKTQYFEKINQTNFINSINFYGDNELKFNRIFKELESWQYEQQNHVIEYLREEAAFEFLNSLPIEKQFILGRLLKACASSGHWKTQNLLSSIADNYTKMPDNIKAGIAYGSLVNWKNKYCLDKNSLKRAIKLLNEIEATVHESVYEKANNVIMEFIPNELDKMTFSEPVIVRLTTHILDTIQEWKGNNRANFENLINRIKEKYT